MTYQKLCVCMPLWSAKVQKIGEATYNVVNNLLFLQQRQQQQLSSVIMKTKLSTFLRSIGAIVIGILLIRYSNNAVLWLTILIGMIFLISGLVACFSYFAGRHHSGIDGVQILDASGRDITPARPPFPIVGLGSILLGALLTFAPTLFLHFLVYGLAFILVLGAINQFLILQSASRMARIGLFWWIIPVLIFLTGLIALVKPSLIASAPLYIIGWCMIVYGIIEIINNIKIRRCRRDYVHAVEIQEKENDYHKQTEE